MSKVLFLVLFSFALSAEGPLKINSQLKEVRVYQPGASLYREANLKLSAGKHQLLFTDLSIGLDPNSIQLFSEGDLEILSFELIQQKFEDRSKPAAYLAIEAEIDALKNRLNALATEERVIKAENELLAENRKLGGNSGYSLQELKAISLYVKERTKANLDQFNKLQIRKKELQKELEQREATLQEVLRKFNLLGSAILVHVSAPQTINTTIGLAYSYHSNVNWQAVYRLKFESLDAKLELQQFARINQYTGEDWENVKLTLSTGSPSSENQLPSLSTKFIHLYSLTKPIAYSDGVGAQGTSAPEPAMLKESKLANRAPTPTEMETRLDYVIDGLYSLASEKEERFPLRTLELNASYQYETVPKLNEAVFLTASVKDYEQYQLIPGSIDIFNQGAYTGRVYSNFEDLTKGLKFSLGKDRSFKVEHERIFKEERESLFGGTKEEEYHYRISVKHSKSRSIKIKILDQIPISTHEKLKVDLLEAAGGKLDLETGLLRWEVEIAPNNPQQLDFKYKLKYPSDKRIR